MNDQTIFRRAKDRDNPYVMVDKSLFENDTLSWQAKGLMGYLLSRPDDWVVRMGDLVKRSPEGMTTIRATIKELEDQGYLVRHREHDERGFFQWVTEVHETPVQPSIGLPSMVEPSMDSPSTVKPSAVNHTLLNTDLTETECTKEESPSKILPDSEWPTDSNLSPGDDPSEQPSILEQTDPLSMAAECSKRADGRRPWTVTGPEGANPWEDGPVTAYCKLTHMPNAPPGQVESWAREFERIAGRWEATPAQFVMAVGMISKDKKHDWRSFTSPFNPSFEGVIDVMLSRVKSGQTTNLVIRND